ncbi:MAG: hypothetical protein LBF22_07055 [Deltaproteobacteria bacterium]|jgi:hypothetical protein|nr:hypothetical protein [Deltaproteobacteria bacterium]
MSKCATIEEAIDAIRTSLSEKSKNMTAEEFNDYLQTHVYPIFKKYGIKTISKIEPSDKNSK